MFAVREPVRLTSGALRWTRYRLRYADGPRDAESLLVDPRSGRVYVISKQAGGAGTYQGPARLSRKSVNVLRRVAGAPPLVTDGSFSPDGTRVALRDYVEAHVYDRPGGTEQARVTLPIQQQGESLTWTTDGQQLLVGSEGADTAACGRCRCQLLRAERRRSRPPGPALPALRRPAPGPARAPPGSGRRSSAPWLWLPWG